MRTTVDGSSFGSLAALPFPDKLSNTLGLASGQVDQDHKHGRAIQKVQGPVSCGVDSAPQRQRTKAGHLRLLRPPRPRGGRWDLSIL